MSEKHIDQKEIRRENGLINRNRYAYEMIEPKPLYAPRIKVRRHPIKEKLEDTPLGWAVLSGAGAYALFSTTMTLTQNIHKPHKVIGLLSGTLLTAAIGGVMAHILESIHTNELIHRKYIEYTQSYIDLERNISEEISDDTRVTRSVFLYRRDLYDGIKRRASDLGFKDALVSPCSYIYSEKSKKQLLEMLCAEFGNIHAEFVEDIRKGKLFSISSEEIMIDVKTKEAMDRIKAASKCINEVFGMFDLKPVFYAVEESVRAMSELVL